MYFKVDFETLKGEKESFVREFIITPLLKELGFIPKGSDCKKAQEEKLREKCLLEVELEKTLNSSTITGANKKAELNKNRVDYVLYINKIPHCVLEAKAPKEKIINNTHERQALYYAINQEIKAPYYALCNGFELTLFQTNTQTLLKKFDLAHFSENDFLTLKAYLATPLDLIQLNPITSKSEVKEGDSWYLEKTLPQELIKKPQKQAKARYFGCTAYFTRQSWDIVTQNILNFTQKGDVVLDPFGGSGVSAIESCINGRYGIHTDLNPLSIFMTKALCAKVNLSELYELSEEILQEFEEMKPKNQKEAKEILKNAKYYPNAIGEEFGKIATQKEQDSILWIPKDELLPKGSDVDSVLKLFSPMQLAELALLRKIIFKKSFYKKVQIEMRYSLMLAFYNTLSLINLTYHSTPKGGGNYFAFYYRYRIAKNPTFLNTAEIYRQKIKRILKGKQELEISPNFYPLYFNPLPNVIKEFKGSMLNQRDDLAKVDSKDSINGERFFQADATNLKEIESKSVDYIYTDPPYGAKIPYLDLSTMWNAWLDFSVDKDLKQKECIEKGSLNKSRAEYQSLMQESLKEMYRVLKPNRWLSFVFQHQDPQLWQVLVEAAEEIGFEYIGSVRQDNGQTTFKKRQNPFSVLSGQLIIHFKKVDNPKSRVKEELGYNFSIIVNCVQELIMRKNGATLDEIYNAIMQRAMDGGFLKELSEKFDDIFPFVKQKIFFDEESKLYQIKEFDPHKDHLIPLEVRAKYFIVSYLNKCTRLNQKALFDDICLEIIPLLKNGVTPSADSIKDILEQIAFVDSKTGEWRLKPPTPQQPSLFDINDC